VRVASATKTFEVEGVAHGSTGGGPGCYAACATPPPATAAMARVAIANLAIRRACDVCWVERM